MNNINGKAIYGTSLSIVFWDWRGNNIGYLQGNSEPTYRFRTLGGKMKSLGHLKITPFTEFKKSLSYKIFSKNIDVNMYYLGFVEAGWNYTDGEKSKMIVEQSCKARGWDNGIAVWRKRAGDCGLQIINVYYKEG